jgi:hypothetical protein
MFSKLKTIKISVESLEKFMLEVSLNIPIKRNNSMTLVIPLKRVLRTKNSKLSRQPKKLRPRPRKVREKLTTSQSKMILNLIRLPRKRTSICSTQLVSREL